jgi:hypothetical protein
VTFFALLEDYYPGRLAVKDRDKTHRITGGILINIIIERRGRIVIMDPFYMDELFLGAPGNRAIVLKYIEDFMVANKDKDCFLMPYFPE